MRPGPTERTTMTNATAPDSAAVTAVTEAILADVGSQMSELYSAIPDLLCEHHPDWQALSPAQQDAWVKAVGVELGGEGYTP